MTKKDLQTIMAVVGIFVFAALIYNQVRQKKKIKELEDEREDLKNLLTAIKNTDSFSEEIKKSLTALCKKYKNIDESIANEIAEALQLLQIGQHENSIKSLVKIMEHLLNRKLSNDTSFISWLSIKKKKKPTLHDMLDYSKETSIIDNDEHSFFIAVKAIRNKEAHEVGYQAFPAIKAAGILCALHGIFRLSEMIYPRKFKTSHK